jgi:lipopolysaccharide biosynthesis glycosyltransferase
MGLMHVACGGDVAYLEHSAAMIASALHHRGNHELHVHYLHEPALRDEDAQLLERMVTARGGQISFLEVSPERIAGLPGVNHLTPATWYRVFVPDLLPEVSRVIYIDADAIVMDDLGPLWDTDLDGAAVAAVTNVFEPWNLDYVRSLDLPRPYFNAGILLMDLDVVRELETTRRVLEYAEANLSRLPWGDQCPLNVVLSEHRLDLHPRWNCMNSIAHFDSAAEVLGPQPVAQARAQPGIRHFEGPSINKPWHFLCQWQNREEYFRFRRETPWPNVRREGVTPRNVVRKLKRQVLTTSRPE